MHFLELEYMTLDYNFAEIFLMDLIDNKWALFQVMAWRRSGDKPLSEPMFTQFTDAYMGHLGGDELR